MSAELTFLIFTLVSTFLAFLLIAQVVFDETENKPIDFVYVAMAAFFMVGPAFVVGDILTGKFGVMEWLAAGLAQ